MGKHKRFLKPRNLSSDERRLIIQFRVRIEPDENSLGAKDRLEAALLAEVARRGWDCYIGALGGRVMTYGALWNPSADLTIEDRRSIADWIASQPIRAAVGLGDPEPMGESDIRRQDMSMRFAVGG